MNDCLSKTNPEQQEKLKGQRPKWTSQSREIPPPSPTPSRISSSSSLFWYLFKTEFSICNNVVRRRSLPQATRLWFVSRVFESQGRYMFVGAWALSSVWLTRDTKKMYEASLAHCYLIIGKREPLENGHVNAGKCKAFACSLTSALSTLFCCTDCKAASHYRLCSLSPCMQIPHGTFTRNPVDSYLVFIYVQTRELSCWW